ncbi:MAG: glycosyltransferase family 4 protein [Chlorobiaceae bacterium]|nr:glycosyltransferase family 4 protein [Chlorobiaceae bacterium]
MRRYPDVAAARLDPFKHWLEYGLFEGRPFNPLLTVLSGEAARMNGCDAQFWNKLTFLGVPVAYRLKNSMDNVVAQIMGQTPFEPTILAPGALCIPSLREFDAPNLADRRNIDTGAIFSAVRERPDMVICTPFLCAGGAEKYAADIVDVFVKKWNKKVLVLVTEQSQESASGWDRLAILDPLKEAQIIHCPDVFGPGYNSPVIFARFLNSIRPQTLIVNNSKLALDAVADYGRGLSTSMEIFCTFFSMGLNGLGVPNGTRYPQRCMPFSVALTDNGRMATSLAKLWGPLAQKGVATIPPRIACSGEAIVEEQISALSGRFQNSSRVKRWLWVSRIEALKGAATLARLAGIRSKERFDLFGPVTGDLQQYGLDLPNISYRGIVDDVLTMELSQYDGFIFTSKCEGMPNVVLEMSQRCIPMVLSDVGGLRETFTDESVLFVANEESDEQTALLFDNRLESLGAFDPPQVERLVRLARALAIEKHSPEAFTSSVEKVFALNHD